jgi:hypothetical protein
MANDINALTEIFTVLAFMDDGSAAPSARLADFVILHWSLQNNTDSPISIRFPQGRLFTLKLCKTDGTEIWTHQGQTPGADIDENVAVDTSFDIPKNEESVDERIPRVPLKTIITQQNIPDTDDLVVKFSPLLDGVADIDVNAAKLWR